MRERGERATAEYKRWDGGRLGEFGCGEETFGYEERDCGVARGGGGGCGGGHGNGSD